MIAITGAEGQLGKTLQKLLDELNMEFVSFSRLELDISDEDSISRKLHKSFDVLINCAAWTNVEKAETDASQAFKVNKLGPRNLAQNARKFNTRLIHISTDYVFSGEKTSPYNEDDPIKPLNQYGMSKADGEQELIDVFGCTGNFLIIRTSWLYSEYGANFAKTMVRKALLGETVKVVDDQFGQPTHAYDLASRIINFYSNRDLQGIFHIASDGETNWYEFAKQIYKLVDAEPNLVSPIHSTELNLRAKRPSYSTLNCSKAYSHGISRMPVWSYSLSKNIKEIIREVRRESSN